MIYSQILRQNFIIYFINKILNNSYAILITFKFSKIQE